MVENINLEENKIKNNFKKIIKNVKIRMAVYIYIYIYIEYCLLENKKNKKMKCVKNSFTNLRNIKSLNNKKAFVLLNVEFVEIIKFFGNLKLDKVNKDRTMLNLDSIGLSLCELATKKMYKRYRAGPLDML